MRQIVKPSAPDLEQSSAQKRQSNTEQAALHAYYRHLDPDTRFLPPHQKANPMTSNEKPPETSTGRVPTPKGSPLLPSTATLQELWYKALNDFYVSISTAITEHASRVATDRNPPEPDAKPEAEHSTHGEGEPALYYFTSREQGEAARKFGTAPEDAVAWRCTKCGEMTWWHQSPNAGHCPRCNAGSEWAFCVPQDNATPFPKPPEGMRFPRPSGGAETARKSKLAPGSWELHKGRCHMCWHDDAPTAIGRPMVTVGGSNIVLCRDCLEDACFTLEDQ